MSTNRSRYYVESVSDLSDEALRCHAFGHAWDVGPVSRLSPVGREVWTVKLRCTSCTKVRTDYVTPGTYELEDRHYTRPDGYSVAEGGADRARYREEIIVRAQRRTKRRTTTTITTGEML